MLHLWHCGGAKMASKQGNSSQLRKQLISYKLFGVNRIRVLLYHIQLWALIWHYHGHCVRIRWCRGKRIDHVNTTERHLDVTPGLILWGTIGYDLGHPELIIDLVQPYISDIMHQHVLTLLTYVSSRCGIWKSCLADLTDKKKVWWLWYKPIHSLYLGLRKFQTLHMCA